MFGTDRSRLRRKSEFVRFRRALMLLGMTLVLPGSAQLLCGNKSVGRAALRIVALVLLIGGVGLVYLGKDGLVDLAVDTSRLIWIEVALVVLAGCWVALFVDALRLGRPPSLRRPHRLVVALMTLALMAGVAAPMAYGARMIDLQRHVVNTVFQPGGKAELYNGRLNILLLGGDGGLNRRGIRTDSISLASIDVATGKTVMFALPRNLQYAQFPPGTTMAKQFPNGFPDFFFGIYTWAQENRQLFPKVHDPGALAVEQAVAQTLGIPVHYYALVNLSGFQKLVDSLGGITLRVNERLPIGGGDNLVTGGKNPILGWIEPGLQKLDGYRALWYARSRSGAANGDYDRMDRQRCVFGALLNQADPLNVLKNYSSIAESIGDVVATDITQDELERLVDVSRKSKKASITSVNFTNRIIDSANPDIAYIRGKVQQAIAKSEAIKVATPTASAAPKATKKPATKKTPKATPKPTPVVPGQSVEIADSCQYK